VRLSGHSIAFNIRIKLALYVLFRGTFSLSFISFSIIDLAMFLSEA